MSTFTVLVCGGRDYVNYVKLALELNNLHEHYKFDCLVSGGARGADSLAEHWANQKGIPTKIYKADWERDGKAAGPIRNELMLRAGKPDLVVSFPGGAGTADMVRRAQKANIPVYPIHPSSEYIETHQRPSLGDCEAL